MDGERVLLAVRPHGRVLAGPALVLLVMAPVTVVMAAFVPSSGPGPLLRVIVVLLGSAVVVRGALVPFLAWRATVFAVTTHRVVVRRGVLRATERAVALDRVVDVTLDAGRWDRLLGCGRLRVEATGSATALVLSDVPAALQVQRAVRRSAPPPAAPTPAAAAPAAPPPALEAPRPVDRVLLGGEDADQPAASEVSGGGLFPAVDIEGVGIEGVDVEGVDVERVDVETDDAVWRRRGTGRRRGLWR